MSQTTTRVFVAGATGVAGASIVPALVAAGHDVTASVRSPAKAQQVRAWGATPVEVDLFDADAVQRVVDGHQAVANFSTHIPSLMKAALPGAWKENDRLRRQVCANLVGAALAAGSERFVQESIGFLYPDRGEEWIDEGTPLRPNAVTQSAVDAEASVARISEAGHIGVVLRFAQFYGPDSSHCAEMVRMARRLGIGPIPGEPGGFTSWIHQDDLGSAVVAALGAPGGTYNVADDEPIRRHELFDLLAAALGRTHLREIGNAVAKLGGRKAEAITRSQRISAAKFRSATGWAPTITSARQGWPLLVKELVGAG
jgi:nucleoside-diphosphate-sugar epimerase